MRLLCFERESVPPLAHCLGIHKAEQRRPGSDTETSCGRNRHLQMDLKPRRDQLAAGTSLRRLTRPPRDFSLASMESLRQGCPF